MNIIKKAKRKVDEIIYKEEYEEQDRLWEKFRLQQIIEQDLIISMEEFDELPSEYQGIKIVAQLVSSPLEQRDEMPKKLNMTSPNVPRGNLNIVNIRVKDVDFKNVEDSKIIDIRSKINQNKN